MYAYDFQVQDTDTMGAGQSTPQMPTDIVPDQKLPGAAADKLTDNITDHLPGQKRMSRSDSHFGK